MVLRHFRARGGVVVLAAALACPHEAVTSTPVEPGCESGRSVDARAVPLHGRLRAASLVVVLAVLSEARHDHTERPRNGCRRCGQSNRSHECLECPHNASLSTQRLGARSVDRSRAYVVPAGVSHGENLPAPLGSSPSLGSRPRWGSGKLCPMRQLDHAAPGYLPAGVSLPWGTALPTGISKSRPSNENSPFSCRATRGKRVPTSGLENPAAPDAVDRSEERRVGGGGRAGRG